MVFTNIERSKLPTVENQVFLFAVNFVTHKRHNKREKHSLKETGLGKKKNKNRSQQKKNSLIRREKIVVKKETGHGKRKNACRKRKWLTAKRRKIVTVNNSCSLK